VPGCQQGPGRLRTTRDPCILVHHLANMMECALPIPSGHASGEPPQLSGSWLDEFGTTMMMTGSSSSPLATAEASCHLDGHHRRPLAPQPTAQLLPPSHLQFSVLGRCGTIQSFARPADDSVDATNHTIAEISSAFGLEGPWILRHDAEGWVTLPCLGMAAGGALYRLETPSPCPVSSALPPPPPAPATWAGSTTTSSCLHGEAVSLRRQPQPLEFVARPPCGGGCEWLTVSSALGHDGVKVCRPAAHVFHPAPAIVLTCRTTDPDALARGRWTLWSPLWQDVSHHLHVGGVQLGRDRHGRPQACWPSMGVTEISAAVKPPPGALPVSGTAAERAALEATGWFHLTFSLGADHREPLLLRDRGTREAGKLVVKHERCAAAGGSGGWSQRGLGPYACHAACVEHGAHHDGQGNLLCAHHRKHRNPKAAAEAAACQPCAQAAATA
jgi:hypothetical protein